MLIIDMFNGWLNILEPFGPLFLLIDSIVYKFFGILFSLFMKIAEARIFNVDAFDSVFNNIYVLVGVVALFIFSIQLLRMMVNPDKGLSGDETPQKLVIRILLVMIFTSLVPVLFDFLYDFQNSILSNQVLTKIFFGSTTSNVDAVYYTDENGNYIFTSDCNASSYEEALSSCEKVKTNVTTDDDYMELLGYQIGLSVLEGFLHPVEGTADADVVVNASDRFDTSSGLKLAALGCAIGGGIATTAVVALEIVTSPATGFATLTAVPGTIAAFSGTIATACGAGLILGGVANGIGYAVSYEKYTWEMAKMEIETSGNFDRITAFNGAITQSKDGNQIEGKMEYMPILSTIAGIIICWMMFSFTLDLGVRAAKLFFYQMIAPLSFILSILPGKKDLMGNWFKLVLTTYLEVFVRIVVVLIMAYAISALDFSFLN